MPAQKLHEEFTPGRGYTKEDWDEVSDNPELTDEELAQGTAVAEMFPGVTLVNASNTHPQALSDLLADAVKSEDPHYLAMTLGTIARAPRHVRRSQGSRRNPRGALQSPVGGRRSEAEHAFRRRPRSRAEADNQRGVAPMTAELRGRWMTIETTAPELGRAAHLTKEAISASSRRSSKRAIPRSSRRRSATLPGPAG